jgi:carbamoyltransferase
VSDDYVLGVTMSVHDSSACLIHDGRLVAAVEEERLVRRKHTGEFPIKAIEYCLSSQGITYGDLRCVAYTQAPWLKIPQRLFYVTRRLPRSVGFVAREMYWYLLTYGQVRTWPDRLKTRLLGDTGAHPRHLFFPHHETHAASAFFASPFEEAAVCSIDQRGEWTSTFMGRARGERIRPLAEISYPNSLGLFYLMLTLFLGFDYHEEYEVMGLAAYGRPRYLREMEKIIRYTGRLRFRLDDRYLSSHWNRIYSGELETLLGPKRHEGEALTERHCDIAASLQATTEHVVFSLLRDLHRATGTPRLCLAGGVALNSVMNGKIPSETPFRDVFVQPAAHDAGGSIGAAYLAAVAKGVGSPRRSLSHLFLGPEYSDPEVKALLDAARTRYEIVDDVEATTAGMLAAGNVIGWFQGRLEFGPRALGHRSILADPRRPEMRDRVNLLVKERQSFRPFAPAILEERAADYLLTPQKSPYMTMVGRVTERAAREIPAVVHVDGTARVQTVSRDDDPRFWRLLREFDRITSVPVLLNTSFNLRGEPIVCTPRDALRTYFTSGLDALVIGRYVLRKKDTAGGLSGEGPATERGAGAMKS